MRKVPYYHTYTNHYSINHYNCNCPTKELCRSYRGQISYPPVPVLLIPSQLTASSSQPQLDKPEGGAVLSIFKEATAMKGDETADILFQNPSKVDQV